MATLKASGSAAASNANAPTCTLTLDTTGATLLVLAVACFDYNGRYVANSNAPSDSNGNTWTGKTLQVSADTFSGIRVFYVNSASPTVGSGHVFTAGSTNDTAYPLMWVWAIDSTSSGPFNAESGNVAAGSPTSIQQAASVGSSGDFAVCAVCNNLGTGTSQAIDSGFTITGTKYGFVGGTHGAGAGAYLNGLSGAVQPTWSGLDGSGTATAIATFTTSGGGGGGGKPFLYYAQQRRQFRQEQQQRERLIARAYHETVLRRAA